MKIGFAVVAVCGLAAVAFAGPTTRPAAEILRDLQNAEAEVARLRVELDRALPATARPSPRPAVDAADVQNQARRLLERIERERALAPDLVLPRRGEPRPFNGDFFYLIPLDH